MLTATKDVGKGFILVTMSATVFLVSDSTWYGSYGYDIPDHLLYSTIAMLKISILEKGIPY
jgi:hypothetical protein